MDLLWVVGLTVIAVIVLLKVLVLLIGMNRLLKLQLWTPRKTPCLRAASGDLLPVLDAARTDMELAGFRYMHSWRERSMIAADDIPASYCDVYHHLAQDVHAEVYPSESPFEQRLYTVYLWNTYVDGKALLTVNGQLQSMVPYPSRVAVISDKSADLAGQLVTHLHVREMINVQRSDPADAPKIAQNLAERWLVRLDREAKVYQRSQSDDESIYGFRFWPSLKMAWQMRKASAPKSAKQRPTPSDASTATKPLIDMRAARQLRDRYSFVRTLCALRSMLAPRWYQSTGFVLSALAFVALGTWWWGITGALLIGGVIALHEGGHWLAMKLAGFRDVQVFFVPGMGGMTSGEKHEAAPFTHMLVYLAGPMPGLLLSLASIALVVKEPTILNTVWGPYLTMAALASLLVNGFNLLPVLPLDGGRVIELLVMARLPWLRFLFSLCSGAAMLAYGLHSSDKILLGVGILALISAQFQYRLAKAASLLSRQSTGTADNNRSFAHAAGDLFDFLGHASFSKWSYATKLAVGQTLLQRYLGRQPGWKESCAGLGLYIVCIILPVAMLFSFIHSAPTTMLSMAGQGLSSLLASSDANKPVTIAGHEDKDSADALQEDRMASRQARAEKITAAQGSERTAILRSVLDEASDNDAEDALRIAKIYYAENNNSLQATYLHADAALAMANAIRNWSDQDEPENARKNETDVANYLQEAEAILRARLRAQSDRRDTRLLAEVLQARDIDPDNPAQLILKEEVVSLFAKEKTEDDTQLLQAHQMLARAYYKSGRVDDAEHQLQTAEDDYACQSKDKADFFCHTLKIDEAWLLLNKKKFAEAQTLLSPVTDKEKQPGQNDLANRERHQIKWMIAMLQKDYRMAKEEAMALTQLREPGTGIWLIDLYIQRNQPAGNLPADLMLIETLRARGEQGEADKIAERLLEAQRKAHSEPGNLRSGNTEMACKIYPYGSLWKNQLQQTLLNIEQRETHCTPRAGMGHMSR
ncbi:site-2 protease family protein [Undibacterium sp. Ji42W]|uniref:site-2 protease family protein n=1 Tax=Undibacterium sp. Ji42W TaxID=3413039 RepID=UPI003BF3F96E